jgi:hypothetical protein
MNYKRSTNAMAFTIKEIRNMSLSEVKFQPYMEKCSWTKNECVPKNHEMGSFDQIYISY